MENAIAYLRVSTGEQAQSGAGLAAQRASILAEAERRGWTESSITFIEDAGFSGKDLKRPGIEAALDALRKRKADTLVVAKLDRLSRSMLDFAGLMERASHEKWALVALDVGVDTTTAAGEMVAHVLATFAQFERRLISQRTKDALAAKRAQGVRLGVDRVIPQLLSDEIRSRRAAGATLAAIADELNRRGEPTTRGGRRWYPSTIRRVLVQDPIYQPERQGGNGQL